MWHTIVNIFPYAIALAVPLLITSLGGLYSERSGVVNIGLEGLMVVGGFASAVCAVSLYPSMGGGAVWVSLIVAMLVGAVFSLLHAFASISLNANQVIIGTAINMIAGAVTVFLARTFTGSGNIQLTQGMPRFNVPVLADIPVIGPILFNQDAVVGPDMIKLCGCTFIAEAVNCGDGKLKERRLRIRNIIGKACSV